MRAIILVAGRGSRLPRNLSKKPKSFIKIGSKTILERQIDNFQTLGINKISLVTGYKSEFFKRYKIKKFHNHNWKHTNMVYSLTKANSWLKKHNCIVSYGDILYEKNAIKSLIKSKNLITITYDKNWKKLWKKRFVNPLSDAETFKISKNNKILEIGKKTNNINEIQGQYMGLMKFKPQGWKIFKKCLEKDFKRNFNNLYLTDVFQKLIEKKIFVQGCKYQGKWAEVDSKNDYLVMKKIFKK